MNTVTTPLLASKDLGNKNYFNLSLRSKDISLKTREKLAKEASRIAGNLLASGAIPAGQPFQLTRQSVPPADWRKIEKILSDDKLKAPEIPDPERVNIPAAPIVKMNRASATFRNVIGGNSLDTIPYPRNLPLPGETNDQHIRRITRELAGKAYDPQKSKTRDSLNGVAQSVVPRQDYEATYKVAAFGNREFISREEFAKNGYVPGSVASSFNRFADRPTLLRAITAEDGSIDSFAGRAFDLASAKDVATYAFLRELSAPAAVRQGVKKEGSHFVFEFMVQSLLPTYGGSEAAMYRKEVKAYQELAKKGMIVIQDPNHPAKKYHVRFKPLPIAATQFNYLNSVEQLLPASLSGENEARDASSACDAVLFKKAKAFPNNRQIQDTVHFLRNAATLKPWQELMTRSYLAHLLNIPLVVHCKSCVDRTNVQNAMVTAMKQWIRSGKAIPQKEGRFAIFELPAQVAIDPNGKTYCPFKELFALSLHKGLKITEFSRGKKGYKFNRGWAQHPTLRDLLPKNYLKTKVESTALRIFKRWVLPILGWLTSPLLTQALAWAGLKLLGGTDKEIGRIWSVNRKIWKKTKIGAVVGTIFSILPLQFLAWGLSIVISFGKNLFQKRCYRVARVWDAFLMPFKFIKNADALFPTSWVNEKYRKVGESQLLYKGFESGPFQDSDS